MKKISDDQLDDFMYNYDVEVSDMLFDRLEDCKCGKYKKALEEILSLRSEEWCNYCTDDKASSMCDIATEALKETK